MLSSGT